MTATEKISIRSEGATACFKYKAAIQEGNGDVKPPVNKYPEDTEKAKYWEEGYQDESSDGCSSI